MTHIDAPFHAYQIEVARALCAEGRLIGYDPFFAAGHVGGVPFNASAKFQALLACLNGSPGDGAGIFKRTAFALAVAAPAAFPIALARLRIPPGASAIATLFALFLWWAGPLRWYHTAGMVSFVGAAFLSIWYAPFVLNLCHRAGTGPFEPRIIASTAVACIIGAAGVLLHPLFAISAALLATCLAITTRFAQLRPIPTLTVGAAVVASTLALNLPWIFPTIDNAGWGQGASPFQRLVGLDIAVSELLGRAPTAAGGSRLYPIILLSVLCSPWLIARQHRRVAIGMVATAFILIAFAFLGGYINTLAILQPNRMAAIGWLILCVPTGLAVAEIPRFVARSDGAARTIMIGFVFTLIAGVFFYTRELILEVFRDDGPRYGMTPPEVKGLGETTKAIVRFLREHAIDDGRVLFETSKGRAHDGGHIAGLLALATGKELIGGPYPYLHFAAAWDRWAFGKNIAEHSSDDLARYLDLYNITWMLCHTGECVHSLESLPTSRRRAIIGPVTILQRDAPISYAMDHDVRVVSRGFNNVELEIPPTPEVVLKYHWVEGLSSDPPANISPWRSPLDPGPFVRIVNPPMRLRLYYSGR